MKDDGQRSDTMAPRKRRGGGSGVDEKKQRLERALRPRIEVFSRRFNSEDIKRWSDAAQRADMSIIDWVETELNLAVANPNRRKIQEFYFESLTEDQKKLFRSLGDEERKRVQRILKPRDEVFSRKFNPTDIANWRRAAKAEGFEVTDWIELHLNAAAAAAKH